MTPKDGGPAFPTRIPLEYSADQGKEYPGWDEAGMSLRDWFAGQALTALVHIEHEPAAARHAYVIADAMLKARKEGTP